MEDLPTLRSGLAGAARDPVVWIFVVAGGLEVFTGDFALHATLLVVVAAVLLAGGVRGWGASAPGQGSGGSTDGPVRERERAPADRQDPTPAPMVASLGRRGRGFRLVGLVAVGVYAVAVGSLRRYSPPATVAVTVPALAALVWVWRVPGRAAYPPPLHRLGAAAWLCLFAAFGIWELIALFFQPSLRFSSKIHPTFSRLLDPALAHPAGRMLGLAVWVLIGWLLLERA